MHIYFKELQSVCPEKIFVYAQLKTVKYADYKKGLIYINPDFLKTDKYESLIIFA